jgi:hypothetical protein
MMGIPGLKSNMAGFTWKIPLNLSVGHALDDMLPNSAMKSLESFRLKLLKSQKLARVEVCLEMYH